MSPTPVRQRRSSSPAAVNGAPKPRSPQAACDACRLRKIRCKRADGETSQGVGVPRCDACDQLDIPCTFNYRPKRPGPRPGYLRRLREDGQGSRSTKPGELEIIPTEFSHAPTLQSFGAAAAAVEHETPRERMPWESPSPMMVTEHRTSYPELSPTQIIPPPSAPLPLPPGPRASVVSEPSSAFEQLFASPSDSIHFGAPGSGTGTGTGPTQSTPNPFDVVLTRPILYAILAAWFDYIYCLIPLPDRMALHHDLEQRREERPGEEEWTAMVFAMIGSTIVQVPNQLIPVNPKDMRPLVKLCFDKANGLIAGRPTTRSVNRIFTMYKGIAHLLGMTSLAREYNGTNMSLALHMGLDQEATYAAMDPLEGRMTRRMWWIMYSGDRSAACCEGERMLINEDDVGDVAMAFENEDPVSPEPGIPGAGTSIMSGFFYITKIWRIAGRILSRRQRDLRHPPSGSAIRLCLAEISNLLDELDQAMVGCPPVLALDLKHEGQSGIAQVPDDWLASGFPQYSQGMLLVKEEPRRAFIIQQANIYITQQGVRFVGLQYQEQLFNLQQRSNHPSTPLLLDPVLRSESVVFHKARNQILSELLQILHTLPLELVAVNSLPGVTKIRYVASTLLTELEGFSGEEVGEGASELVFSQARAQAYLAQYLTYLSKIESLYSLGEE